MNTKIKYLFLFVLFASILAACGAPAPTATPANPTDVPATEPTAGSTASSNFPSGKFIKAGTTNYGLLFNADGTFSAFDGNRTFIQATYTVEGDVFTETSNTGGCETNESFTYTFDGTNLTFNYVGNPDDDTACAGRHADFNNVTYALTSVPHAAAVITQNFWDAILANDIDEAMVSVADDVVTSGGPQSFTDRVKFGAFMISKMEIGITYEISDLRVVSEDTVTYDMKVYENGKLIASGLTTLQVADGKIIKIKLP